MSVPTTTQPVHRTRQTNKNKREVGLLLVFSMKTTCDSKHGDRMLVTSFFAFPFGLQITELSCYTLLPHSIAVINSLLSSQSTMRDASVKCLVFCTFFFLFFAHSATALDGPQYDSAAYTECKTHPEPPLYNGGILKGLPLGLRKIEETRTETGISSPSFVLSNLAKDTRYTFSCWVKVRGTNSTLVKARLSTENYTYRCIGSALVKPGCWFFLKGGFVLDSPSNTSLLYFQSTGNDPASISVASSSLQPFTNDQWSAHQEDNIRTKRKRVVTIHVADAQGNRLPQASVTVRQISKDFPFGSAISKSILGNSPYQKWFVDRFNAAVFENELKWYATEPEPGKLNYTYADKMLEFVRSNQIVARGHNIFWEDPIYTPAWVRNLTGSDLLSAVTSRIRSLMGRYKGEFVHWDVSNEMLHFNFYEQRLGHNTTFLLFNTAQQSDPLATLFMNDFNVVETCDDELSTVDSYVVRLKELMNGGAILEGIGLEGHFTKPNIPLMRAVLDKLGTLGLPIWLTEIDISKNVDQQTQAVYLEQVLREGFSHPSVNGIMLWTAMHVNGCYQMCLTDGDMRNFPVGDVVDKLLQEWETTRLEGSTDDHGIYSFTGFLGEYMVDVRYENRSAVSSLSLLRGDETRHLNVQI